MFVRLLEFFSESAPTIFFTTEITNKNLRSFELERTVFVVLFEFLFVLLRDIQIFIQSIDLIHSSLQLSLLDSQLTLKTSDFSLRLR